MHVTRPIIVIFAACVAILPAALAAVAAQPTPAPDPGALSLPSGMILNDLRGSYRETAFEQNLTITVKTREGDKRTADARIRGVPGPDASLGGSAKLVMQLGDLVVWNTDSAIRAVNSKQPTLYFEAPIKDGDAAKAIAEALPPLPIPQIPLTLGKDTELKDPTPYTTGVKWNDGSLAIEATPRAIMSGKGDQCEVTLTIDAQHSLIREMKATARDGELEIRMTCTEPRLGDAPLAPPSIEGRTKVERLTDLTPPDGAGER
ncbi:MAG TPA: hypothetical protein VG797_01745 [Phycisphaerales bacterium]|nr:hypothetical protein [Phycisphaerales bacterium]